MSRLPEFLTFTGVDDLTSLDDMITLSRRYPIEWGVLFSPKRQGVDRRYPMLWPSEDARSNDIRFSAHLCGAYARTVGAYGAAAEIDIDFSSFSRVQFNGIWGVTNPRSWADKYNLQPILQTKNYTFPISSTTSWLFDQSGGRGKLAKRWPPSDPTRLVGYAGGLAADNIRAVIDAINADGPTWLDMEGRLRNEEDWFDLNRCETVCRAVYG